MKRIVGLAVREVGLEPLTDYDLFVVAGLEKGEEARSRPQRGRQRVVLLHRFLVELHAETVPIRKWLEELHIRIYPVGRVDHADPERIWIKDD
jgi:hypothetical protein